MRYCTAAGLKHETRDSSSMSRWVESAMSDACIAFRRGSRTLSLFATILASSPSTNHSVRISIKIRYEEVAWEPYLYLPDSYGKIVLHHPADLDGSKLGGLTSRLPDKCHSSNRSATPCSHCVEQSHLIQQDELPLHSTSLQCQCTDLTQIQLPRFILRI